MPVRAAGLPLLLASVLALGAAPAVATTSKPPHFSLSIVEGESTLPEETLAHVSAGVENVSHPQVVVSITRGGIVIARDQGESSAWLSQVPQVGDVVTMEVGGQVVGVAVYDGLPSIDPTVCAGSTNFSGQRSGAQEVQGGYYTLVLHTNPYGETSTRRGASGQAQVTALVGSGYAGNFLTPLQLGETVWAEESSKTTLAGGEVFTYSSENDRPVGACPVPPAPPPPPPPPALQGSISKLLRTTIHKLLKLGLSDQVTINQPGTVVQDLYLAGGSVPAYASRKHHHRRPAVLLAKGTASATSAGTVSVVLHPTAKGRHVLRHRRRVRAELLTTLHSASGAKLSLGVRTVTLDR